MWHIVSILPDIWVSFFQYLNVVPVHENMLYDSNNTEAVVRFTICYVYDIAYAGGIQRDSMWTTCERWKRTNTRL